MNQVLLGAIAMASMVAGLFFVRFWRNTRDRFFLFFAMAFWLDGMDRFVLGLTATLQEDVPIFYLVRLVAFSLIIVAILDKNRPRNRGGAGPQASPPSSG